MDTVFDLIMEHDALAAHIAAMPSDPPQELQKALVEAECAVVNTPIIFLADAIAFLDFAYREAAAGNELRLPDLRPALIAAQERIEGLEQDFADIKDMLS